MAIRGARARVATAPAAACHGCEHAGSCIDGALGSHAAWEIEAANPCGALPGDEVELTVAPGGIALLALLAYLLPAGLAVVGAAVGACVGPALFGVSADGGAGLGLVAALIISGALLVALHPRLARSRRFAVTISGVRSRPEAAEPARERDSRALEGGARC